MKKIGVEMRTIEWDEALFLSSVKCWNNEKLFAIQWKISKVSKNEIENDRDPDWSFFKKLFEIVVNWSDRCCCLRDKSLLISTATAFCLNFNDDIQKIILWEKGIKSNSKDEMKGGEMRDEKGRVQITNCPRGS